MADFYNLRILKTAGHSEQDAVELLSLRLDVAGFGEMEKTLTSTGLRFLSDKGIYAWQVRDERVYTSIGASIEAHEVAIFLAGAGAAAFTGEIGRRLATLLQDSAKRLLQGDHEIGDSEALSQAILAHREEAEYAQLMSMNRNERGNRVFQFADGVAIELDRYGNAVTVAIARAPTIPDHDEVAGDD